MTIETSRAHIGSIQVLRATAALLVVMVHVDHQLAAMGRAPLGMGWGARGVDIFFVISGFIMWISADRNPAMGARAFLRRRLERIVPLYWTLTACVLAIALVAPGLLATTRFDGWHAAASLLFLPARHPESGAFWPVIVPGWSLNFEMLFYVLFAGALAAARGSSRARLAWAFGLIAAAAASARALAPSIPVLAFYNPWLLLEFLAGVLLGVAYRAARGPPRKVWLAAIPLGMALLWRFWDHDPVALVGSALLVGGALFAPLPRIAPLGKLGDASYSLYLTQILTLPAAAHAWRAAGLAAAPGVAFAAFAVAIAVAGAFASYEVFERPVDRWLRTRRDLRQHRAQVRAPVDRR